MWRKAHTSQGVPSDDLHPDLDPEEEAEVEEDRSEVLWKVELEDHSRATSLSM